MNGNIFAMSLGSQVGYRRQYWCLNGFSLPGDSAGKVATCKMSGAGPVWSSSIIPKCLCK